LNQFIKKEAPYFSTKIFTGIVEKIGIDISPFEVDIPSQFQYSSDKFRFCKAAK
jgi:hypothetical protein